MFDKISDFQIQMNNRIFVNRSLNLRSINVAGFDMDYTLVLYLENELEALAFKYAVDYLIQKHGYPTEIRDDLKFSTEKIIRGLVIDKKLGNLVKINRFGYIKAALHGDNFISRDDQKFYYANEIVTFKESRYEMVHTMFSLASSSLFCQLVDRPALGKTYEVLFDEIQNSLDSIHRNGILKAEIVRAPEKYVILDEDYARTLQMLKNSGKKLLLITNSDWAFTQAMMSYSYDRFMPEGTVWRDLFDLVIVDAAKPGFFSNQSKFFEVMPETGYLKNVRDPLQIGKIYQGGNSGAIEKVFKVSSGEILYVGDHIYSDVYQSKKVNHWRTMLVITELEDELIAAEKGRNLLNQIRHNMEEKEKLELILDQLNKKKQGVKPLIKELDQMDVLAATSKFNEIKGRIGEIDAVIGLIIQKYDAHFNSHWGELLWAGNDKSHFGMSLERFACVYASKVSKLLFYSSAHYFRPPMKGSPHW